uniref:tRNA dimethylallyltransferase n=1 Tax=Anthurium amnicola TaxID=1678845 RepID=A0A1D1YT43_9ARAE
MSNNKSKNIIIDNDPRKTIPNNFGDVMSLRATTLLLPNEFSGLERICLTANGNLQRILSSWFNKTVTVDVIKNISVDFKMDSQVKNSIITNKTIILDNDVNYDDTQKNDDKAPILKRFDREVNLICEEKIVCNAKSDVIIRDHNIVQLIENDGIGIGQLFRYLDKLPSFHLHYIGKSKKVWWREYSLYISGVECHIKEIFPSNLFDNGWLNGDNNNNSLVNYLYSKKVNGYNIDGNDDDDDDDKVWKLE